MTKNTMKKPTAEDRALELFTDMMIKKIETIQKDWQKPWFMEGMMKWPHNIAGRRYNGMNSFMLMLYCEDNGYKIPCFNTFNCLQRMNGETGKDGKELPKVSVLKGEKSFPVLLTMFICIHKQTMERIEYKQWKTLPYAEQDKYNVFPRLRVYNVFNIDQTNLKESRPELYEKIRSEDNPVIGPKEDGYSFTPADRMIEDRLWICPIYPKHQDNAYFSISKNEIVVPEKKQFHDGESFYGTLFHEMVHSTGAKGVLDRIKPSGFGSEDYAREELVAELGAALVSQYYGMTRHIKDDSCAYLKAWLDRLKQSPQFIKTVLTDVKKAVSMITQKIDEVDPATA